MDSSVFVRWAYEDAVVNQSSEKPDMIYWNETKEGVYFLTGRLMSVFSGMLYGVRKFLNCHNKYVKEKTTKPKSFYDKFDGNLTSWMQKPLKKHITEADLMFLWAGTKETTRLWILLA